MPFCANCGSEVQGRFCAKCGTPLAGPPPGPTTVPPPPSATPISAAGLDENMASALCYLLGVLTGILFLILEPYNKNPIIRFHAFQSIFVWVAVVAVSIVLSIFSHMIAFIPFVGWMVVVLLWPLFGLGVFILWLMLMYKAYNRERWVLPVVGPIAEKQA